MAVCGSAPHFAAPHRCCRSWGSSAAGGPLKTGSTHRLPRHSPSRSPHCCCAVRILHPSSSFRLFCALVIRQENFNVHVVRHQGHVLVIHVPRWDPPPARGPAHAARHHRALQQLHGPVRRGSSTSSGSPRYLNTQSPPGCLHRTRLPDLGSQHSMACSAHGAACP